MTTAKEKNESQYARLQKPRMLLQLPGEIRNMIYTHLFTSTRLTFGYRTIKGTFKRIKPAPNSLAILRTCSLINQEARGLWLGQVLFKFRDPEDMIEKLSVLPSTMISQIRHIQVIGDGVLLLPPGDDEDDVYYRLVWVLKLLPDLCLDTLSVLGSPSAKGVISYDTLDGLVKHGNGWKELHFTTLDSEMLGFERMDLFMADLYRRRPQPSTWNDILIRRDGQDSGASVTIYRSTQSNAPDTVLKPETRQLFEQKPPSSPEDLELFGIEEDRQLLGKNERGKELLVVVKRGHQARIIEQNDPAYFHEHDIRHWAQGLSWADIRYGDPGLLVECEDAVADRYNDGDLYTWKNR